MQDCCLCIRGIVVTIDQHRLKTRCAIKGAKAGWNSRTTGTDVCLSVSSLEDVGDLWQLLLPLSVTQYLDHDLEGLEPCKQGRLAGANNTCWLPWDLGVYTNF